MRIQSDKATLMNSGTSGLRLAIAERLLCRNGF